MIAVEMHGRQTAFVGGFSGVISRRQCRSRVRMCSAAPLVPKLSLVTCDVDGTLLNSSHSVHPNVADAVRESLDQGIKFFCATGKSRQGALNSIGDLGNAIRNIYDGNMPGVYLQGLIVYGLDGNIVYEKTMSEELCWKVWIMKPSCTAMCYYSASKTSCLTDSVCCSHFSVAIDDQQITRNWHDIGGIQRRSNSL